MWEWKRNGALLCAINHAYAGYGYYDYVSSQNVEKKINVFLSLSFKETLPFSQRIIHSLHTPTFHSVQEHHRAHDWGLFINLLCVCVRLSVRFENV